MTLRLAARLGADGVHVAGAGEELDAAIKRLKPERIVGAGSLRTRDEAMTAGEMGADYVMFGEPREGREQRAWRRWRRSSGSRGGRKSSRRHASPTPTRSRRRARLPTPARISSRLAKRSGTALRRARPLREAQALIAGWVRCSGRRMTRIGLRCSAARLEPGRPLRLSPSHAPPSVPRRPRAARAPRRAPRCRPRCRRERTEFRQIWPSGPISAAIFFMP